MCTIRQDANNHIYPIASAIISKWFLELLHEDIGYYKEYNWCFMSDMQKRQYGTFTCETCDDVGHTIRVRSYKKAKGEEAAAAAAEQADDEVGEKALQTNQVDDQVGDGAGAEQAGDVAQAQGVDAQGIAVEGIAAAQGTVVPVAQDATKLSKRKITRQDKLSIVRPSVDAVSSPKSNVGTSNVVSKETIEGASVETSEKIEIILHPS
ncbi:hypothetical protein Ahy_B03g065747 isoform A [Arachis hypogaea]|uniref:Uncharacterized protein n=1 Tax=Arachis hypogaea TaxID=3818 RepID=A0A445A2I8_ARAHY|nr:hypothetical protein Ahy_B03g065747 isoform A [Arachis hypogaea]